jgi:hypothetical protein
VFKQKYQQAQLLTVQNFAPLITMRNPSPYTSLDTLSAATFIHNTKMLRI